MKARINLLDPAPFVAWFDRQASAYGMDDVCRRLGWNPESAVRKVYRWREGSECEDPLALYDACHVAGVDFFTLYDEHFRAPWLFDAATRAPLASRWDARYERLRAHLLDEGEPATDDGAIWRYKRRPGKPTGVHGKMREHQVRAAYVLYIKGGLSLRQLGALLWERYGYATPKACANSLSTSFKLYGLPARDRIDATVAASTRHGLAPRRARASTDKAFSEHRKRVRRESGEIADAPFCAGVRLQYPRKGEPCGNRAMLGSIYCRAHEPSCREDVLEVVARARQNLGLPSQDRTAA